jgi:hypothetical protein
MLGVSGRALSFGVVAEADEDEPGVWKVRTGQRNRL